MTLHARMRAAIAVLIAASCAATGCSNSDGPQTQPAPAATTTEPSAAHASAAPSTGPAAVADSLKFTATTIDGKPFDAAALAGKPVVLWFWAAWCPRCRAKAADVAAVQRNLTWVQVVGVAGLGSGDAAMDRFAADTAITGFPNLADDKGEVWRKFGVTTQEYFVLIDKSGAVVYKGPLSGEDLRQRTNALAS
jgi:peroxiredoxin